MIGGDFPAWLIDILGAHLTTNMTDKLGECVYSSCDHYRKCFIERNVRRAASADIVVANHALVMILAVLVKKKMVRLPCAISSTKGTISLTPRTVRLQHLSGSETAELRRWLIGPEVRHGGTPSVAEDLRKGHMTLFRVTNGLKNS